MVTDHAALVHLLKQPRDKLIARQTHRVEKLMPYANLMRILCKKEILNKTDPISRHPDFLPIDSMYRSDESLWWDGNVHDIIHNGNDLALLALSTLETLDVDDDFPTQLKGA